MTTRPDYRRIAELERQIYGQEVSAWPSAIHERIAELTPAVVREMDDVQATLRDAGRWFLGSSVPDLEGSRFAWGCRLGVWGALGFAGLWVVLMVAGVVPWT